MKHLLVLMLLLSGCSSLAQEPNQKLSNEKFYKRDMIITVNGLVYEGTGVVPRAEKYDLRIEARGNLDLFTMATCHKEETKEKAWNTQTVVKGGLFGWGKKTIDVKEAITFLYVPVPGMEDDGDCPMELGGYEKLQGRHSWGFLEFEGPRYTLPATLKCNGRVINVNGVGVCQAREGLLQKIEFGEIVKPASAAANCGFSGEKDKYEFSLAKGRCVAVFKGLTSNKMHKIVTLGYEDILIRE